MAEYPVAMTAVRAPSPATNQGWRRASASPAVNSRTKPARPVRSARPAPDGGSVAAISHRAPVPATSVRTSTTSAASAVAAGPTSTVTRTAIVTAALACWRCAGSTISAVSAWKAGRHAP